MHYNFTDLDSIKKEIADGMFVESNLVHGNMYGTSRAALQSVEAATQICLLDIDIQVRCRIWPLKLFGHRARSPSAVRANN